MGFIISNHKLWERISFYVTISINIIIIASYSEYFLDEKYKSLPKDSQEYKEAITNSRLFDPRLLNRRKNDKTYALIYLLGIINLILFCIAAVTFIFKRASFILGNIWKGFFKEQDITFTNKIITGYYNTLYSVYMLLVDFNVLYYML